MSSTLGFNQGQIYGEKNFQRNSETDRKRLQPERKAQAKQLKELKKQDSSADNVKHLVTLKEGIIDIRIERKNGLPAFFHENRLAKLKANVFAFYNQEDGKAESLDGAIVLDNFSFKQQESGSGGLLRSSKENCLKLIK
jgi:hypothetical protein